jgi:hypothetical protein
MCRLDFNSTQQQQIEPVLLSETFFNRFPEDGGVGEEAESLLYDC